MKKVIYMSSKQKKYKRKQQLELLEYLYELLDNGYSMQQALGFLDTMIANREIYAKIIAIFEAGENFSTVLKLLEYPQIVQTVVRFGETSGTLKESLKRSASYLKATIELRQKIIRQIQYPLVVLFATLTFIVIFRLFLLPQIETIQQMMGKGEYGSDDMVRYLLMYLPYSIFFIVVVAVTFGLYIGVLHFKKDVRWFITLLKIPVIRHLTKLWNQIQMAMLTRVFFEQGYGVKRLFEEMQKEVYPSQIRFQANKIYENLSRGDTYPQALENLNIYTKDYIQVIKRGIANKTISVDLMFYEQYGNKQFAQTLQRTMQVFLPILYANTGLLIVLSYLSFLLPMLDMLSSL